MEGILTMADNLDLNHNKEQEWYKALGPEQQKQIDSYWARTQYSPVDLGGGQTAMIGQDINKPPTSFVQDNGGKLTQWTPNQTTNNGVMGPGGPTYTPSLYSAIQQGGGGAGTNAVPAKTIAPQYNPEQNMGPLPATNAPAPGGGGAGATTEPDVPVQALPEDTEGLAQLQIQRKPTVIQIPPKSVTQNGGRPGVVISMPLTGQPSPYGNQRAGGYVPDNGRVDQETGGQPMPLSELLKVIEQRRRNKNGMQGGIVL